MDKKTVLNQPEVQDYFKQRFHSLSIDIEGDVEIVDFEGNATTQKEFASKNRVRATPVMAFYDLEGNQVVRYTGATSGPASYPTFRDGLRELILCEKIMQSNLDKTWVNVE